MRRKELTSRILTIILTTAIAFTSMPVASWAQEEIEMQTTDNEENTQIETILEATSEFQLEPTAGPEIPQTTQEETAPEVPATTQQEENEIQTEETNQTSESTTITETQGNSIVDDLKDIRRRTAERIVFSAKDKVSALLEDLIKSLPGGEHIKSIFDLMTGILGDDIVGSIWGYSIVDLGPVIEKLEEIQAKISDISGDVIELKNTAFRNAINEIHRITGQYIGRLITYNKAVSVLKNAPEDAENRAVLEGAALGARASLVELASNPEISQNLKTNLGIAIQYMSNDTLGGTADNPFLINLEAKKNDSSIRYGTELLEQQRQFDKTVWSFFVEGLTLYTACMEINASITESSADAEAIAANLAEILIGSTDGSDSYIGRSVLNAIKVYNTQVRPAEDESIGNYQPKIGDVSSFKVLTNVRTLNYGNQLETTDGSYNTEALMDLTNFQSNGYKNYLKKLNDMINNEYLANYSSITLRHFITEKLGVAVPEKSRYLILSEVRFAYGNYMNVIPLDEMNTSIQVCRFDNQDFDNLCFFSESISQASEKVAEVTFSDKGTIFSFDTFEQAWNFACDYRSNTTVTLYRDVIAQKYGDENFTRFGSGSNFTTKVDKKNVYGALLVKGKITVDLNGHTINRNQDTAVTGGSVFGLDSYSDLTLKNGTVTGGNTTGNGGVVASMNNNTDVTLENMTLKNNHADGYGGAIYYGNGIDYEIKNTTITENTAGKGGGGIYCRAYSSFCTADIVLKGAVTIMGNTVKGRADNAMLNDLPTKKTIFKLDKSFSADSWIGVNTTSTDKWIDITNGSILAMVQESCFKCDRSDQTTEYYKATFGGDWYLRIRNNK